MSNQQIDSMNRIEEMTSRGMLHEELTGKILEASFEVMRELGAGFLEGVYQNALLIALRQKSIKAEARVGLLVRFRGEVVGEYYADLFVEGKVIVELKAVKALAPEHLAQVINYLKATGIEVGLLINFGRPKLEYRRLHN
ncbi:MAG TPA: GxxExxY protein [Blastocatellia bacterium]|nr:GxxExxY protein [Blastocatellia bacterium]